MSMTEEGRLFFVSDRSVGNNRNSIFTCCKRSHKKHKKCCIFLCSVGLLSVACLIVVVALSLSSNDKPGEQSETEHASSHNGAPDSHGEDQLLINQDVCVQDTCFRCEAAIRVEHIPYEPLQCETSNTINNATCYPCNSTCLKADDISRMERIKCKDKSPVRVDCCLVAQVANLEKTIAEGMYSCYDESIHNLYNKSVKQPLWHCQSGTWGDRCKYPNTKKFICKCYEHIYTFLNQDTLPQCNNETKPLRSSVCHTYMHINGTDRHCYCSNKNVTETESLDSCESFN